MAPKLIRAQKPEMPKLLIGLYGASGSGKTLLVSKLAGSKLVFDADGRFMEQASADDEIYFAYETAAENMKIRNITAAVNALMPGNDIQNIIIDTMTMPFQELNDEVEAMPKSSSGNPSREAKTHKAKIMKALRRALYGYNKNVIVIYHTHIHGDGVSDKKIEGKTISDMELARFDMCTNMTLRVVVDPKTKKRGVFVERNRFGHDGFTLWDETGCWDGFWEKLQTEAYKGLTWADMKRKAEATPETFTGLDHAYAWASEQGVFLDVAHAKNAFELLAKEQELDPSDPDEWSAPWISEVKRRVDEVTQAVGADKAKWPAWLKQKAAEKAKATKGKAPTKQAAAPEPTPEPAQTSAVAIEAPTDLPVEPPVDHSASAQAPTEDQTPTDLGEAALSPWHWARDKFTDDATHYSTEIKAQANGKVVTPLQAKSLEAAIAAAAGWDDQQRAFMGMTDVDWVANLLVGRETGTINDFPEGAYKVLGKDIIQAMGGKTNSNYSEYRVNLVKRVANIVDQVFAVSEQQ